MAKVAELPTYEALAGIDPRLVWGVLTRDGEAITAARRPGWERDIDLLRLVRQTLADAAAGRLRGEPGTKPRWFDRIAADELNYASTNSLAHETFSWVRLMERLGMVECEPDDTYVLAMVCSLASDQADHLRHDPELVERALWRVFEVEGGGEVSLTNIDRGRGDRWRKAFLELVADGTLERSRVLVACLQALGRDFLAYRAAWFSGMWLALEPTVEEAAATQSELRRLLAAAVAPTVAFALKQLVRVEKAGLLELEETLLALPPATLVKTKGTAVAALKLARVGRTSAPGLVAEVAATGLGHPHADVQRVAAEVLAGLDLRDQVAAMAEDLSPGLRQELGLGVEVEPASAEPLVQPLQPPIAPVIVEEIGERTAALLEGISDSAEFEAVLAGLVAPGAVERLVPLRKRAMAVVERGRDRDEGPSWLPGQLARVVLGLLGEPVREARPPYPAQCFVVARMGELRQTTAALLATPDLPGGWLSPAALVERLGRTEQVRHHDLVAALLRLHPEGRAAAAATGTMLPPAVRYALDGVAPRQRQGPADWWAAAERSLGPWGEADSPQLHSEFRVLSWTDGGHESHYTEVDFTVDAPAAAAVARDATGWHGNPVRQDGRCGDWLAVMAAIWPHDAEYFLAVAARTVLYAAIWETVDHEVPQVLDVLARHPGRMGALAAATLAAGITAGKREYRMHGVDAFIDLVLPGRVAVGAVVEVMVRHAEVWPANRWAESLAAVAQVPGGGPVVVDLLTGLLPQLPTNHRGMNQLLELLRDESLRLARPVRDATLVEWLGRFQGSSAAAKAARLLLG